MSRPICHRDGFQILSLLFTYVFSYLKCLLGALMLAGPNAPRGHRQMRRQAAVALKPQAVSLLGTTRQSARAYRIYIPQYGAPYVDIWLF